MAESTANGANEVPLVPAFRPTKRRKLYRKRDSSAEPSTETATVLSATTETLDDLILSASNQKSEISVADIIRQRKALQRKRAGIEFSTSKLASRNSERRLDNAAQTSTDAEVEEPVKNRFAPQTGQVADVDKHM